LQDIITASKKDRTAASHKAKQPSSQLERKTTSIQSHKAATHQATMSTRPYGSKQSEPQEIITARQQDYE
jgi:hypothetical protein